MIELKINSSEDRSRMVAILANAGYTVKIQEKKNKDFTMRTDYFVQVMDVEEIEKPTVINCTISGNFDYNPDQFLQYLNEQLKKHGVNYSY